MYKSAPSLLMAFFLVSACSSGSFELSANEFESDEHSFQLVEVSGPLNRPWSISFLPDGSALVSERSGQLHRLSDGELNEVSGVPDVAARGQGGLLDVVPHPEFAEKQLIYFTYSVAGRNGTGTALGRAHLEGTELHNSEELFVQNILTGAGQHFGSRIVFLADGTLVISVGDRGQRDRAQDISDHAGSILRLNDDGTVPADNPWVADNAYLPELYTIGNRNPQGMALHPETGVLWQHEHGPRGGDELNVIEPGRNYGWPVISHGTEYRSGQPIGEGTEAPGMEQPVTYWTPAIAPSGMAIYSGEVFPNWVNNIFIGSLVDTHLRRIEVSGNDVVHQERLLDGVVGRVRDVTVGPDGFIYLVTDEANSPVYRLEPLD